MTRLAVLGSPIAHSRSPLLHAAAYRELALDWRYDRVELTGAALPGFLDGLGAEWRGLSLTMPLKRDVVPLLTGIDDVGELTGGVNTVLLEGRARLGFNTDVAGIQRAFRRSGVDRLENVHVLGSGATAASAIAAVQRMHAGSVTVLARTPANAAPLVELGERLGVAVTVRPLGAHDRSLDVPDAIIDTLPGSAEFGFVFPEAVRRGAVLFAVAYEPWPGPLVRSWQAVDGTVVDGLDMLIEQALVQVRVFVGGSPDAELPDETAVLAAMRTAVAR